ncbi:DUF6262 family protein [Robertmurraya sp.]|uniref:DUF6262 family protein n=1 Tax=Robertmurraya sp. TaxID=2837525 RepID=UPI003704C8CD
MSNFDLKEHLKLVHKNRKAATTQKVDEAIKRLVRANKYINFNSVANEAGVAKATLYNHPNLRERIENLRQQQNKTSNKKQIRRQMTKENKDALIESLRRRVKKLETENTDLRKQLKVAYSEVYKKV